MINEYDNHLDDVKNIFTYDGDENLLRGYIEKSHFACLVFSAAWCPSCRNLSQKINQITSKYSKVTFVHIDVQASPELSAVFRVVKIPTIKICKVENDEIVEIDEIIGSSINRLKGKLNNIIDEKEI